MRHFKLHLKSRFKPLYTRVRRYLPLAFFIEYYRSSRKMENLVKERNRLFDNLVAESSSKKCLQIGVKEKYGAKFGPNWVSVDLYDKREFIDFHYDIQDLKFEDNEFDIIVCISILEHIPYPEKAIQELCRVLKPGDAIWVQLPFNFPYHGSYNNDYWRVSPDGLRVL